MDPELKKIIIKSAFNKWFKGMSQSNTARFNINRFEPRDNNPEAADHARKRIAEIPDQYQGSPKKEDLVGVVEPSSPAAESTLQISGHGRVPGLDNLPRPHGLKHRYRIHKNIKPVLAGIALFALLYVGFKAPVLLSQMNYFSQQNETPAPAANVVQVGPEPILTIPKINVSAPIVFAKSNAEAAIQKDLESGVVHYDNTALPGEPGNAVIFGHSSNDWWEPGNYKFVFVLLDKLVVGDTFTVNYNSKQYVYEVTETKVVEPTDLSVLSQGSTPEMTLITCTPPGTSWKRLIIKSKQISPAPQIVTPGQQKTTSFEKLPGQDKSIPERISEWWQGVIN